MKQVGSPMTAKRGFSEIEHCHQKFPESSSQSPKVISPNAIWAHSRGTTICNQEVLKDEANGEPKGSPEEGFRN